MQKCKTTALVTIRSGLFKLSKEQVRRREHILVKVKGGYEITQPIQFKLGEKFEYQGPVDRALASVLGLSEKQSEKMNASHAKFQAEMTGNDSEAERIAADEEEAKAERIAADEAEAEVGRITTEEEEEEANHTAADGVIKAGDVKE